MDELKSICSSLSKKTCSLDPAPTKIIMENFDILSPTILQIVNKTILESTFPDSLKHAVVTPILKQPALNPEELKNYRPLSSIPFLSKIIEKDIYDQLDNYLETNNLYAYHQSAYRKNYSCESALVELIDDLQRITGNEEEAVLILLDSSAAFDTVDHQILINKLENDFMIKGDALKLLTSYLHRRTFSTKINDVESSPRHLQYGVPQGSLLGPLFYSLYTKSIENIANKHGLRIITYADDCQLYISYKTQNRNSAEEILNNCLQDLKIWMDNMFLKLNADKTIVKVFRPKMSRVSQSMIPKQFLNFDLADSIKTLGVSINGMLKFDDFIAHKVKICNMHLRNLYNIRNCLDQPTRVLLTTNLILSTIDYCNVLLLGATDKSLKPLKLIINRSIRFIYNLRYDEHITPFYKKLHFLPIRQRIQFKACLTVFKVLHGKAPLYLRQHFTPYVQRSSMSLREGFGRDRLKFFLNTDDTKNQRLTTRIQQEWNLLSFETRNCPTLTLFKTKLKTELFSRF
jgi:hypothetical protein